MASLCLKFLNSPPKKQCTSCTIVIFVVKTSYGQVDLLIVHVARIEFLHTSPPSILQETFNPPLNFDMSEDFMPFIFSTTNLRAFSLAIESATLAHSYIACVM